MKIDNVQVYGLEESIRASKYPKSTDVYSCNSDVTPTVCSLGSAKRGSGHDCFLKGIIVQFDLTISEKAWVQAERYHWFDIVSSQSTMHRITSFAIKDQCNRYVDPRCIEVLQEKVDAYNADKSTENFLHVIYNIPSGFELTARITTNYLQLKTILGQREYHMLPDWNELICPWIHTLPRFDEFVLGRKVAAT